jgi:cytochrome c oxidase assembly factor CtaG
MDELLTAWDFEPTVIAGCAALFAGYLLCHPGRGWRLGAFLAADLMLLLALISPLDVLADNYLFSAHMVQHLILLLGVPPLLLLGLSENFARSVVNVPLLGKVERYLNNPILAWVCFTVTIWLWHLPVLYDATLASEGIHIFEHLTFLVTATVFWWPIVSPLKDSRLSAAPAIAYLFAAALSNSLLGILLTFARPGLYSPYLAPSDRYGLLPLLRDSLGLDSATDQQLGGLIMWILGGLVFLGAILSVLTRWQHEAETEECWSTSR